MDDILEKLMKNPYAWLALSLLAIIGFALTIMFAIKSKKVRKISQNKSTYKIIRNVNRELSDLEIKWKSDPIDDLSITKLTIWNDGNIKLEEDDFASSEKLAIEAIEDCKMLNASILLEPEKTNTFNINLNLELNKLFISFEYMDPNNGLVIQIVHTGSADNLRLMGKIKSGKPIKNDENNNDKPMSKRANKFLDFVICHTYTIFMTMLTLIGTILSVGLYIKSGDIKLLILIAVFILLYIIVVYINEIIFKQYIKVPKKLRT